ncbi:hypothetical protein [Bacillus sp. REN16]|uniref:hypothetical protein n=1 Tax=Bacillus sp. REN16 TaxID=2887296 RepID=UPI001E388AA5|nr:hypothetical protein [Bacillus sp. REN16]MCC3359387.1 hypothetical protein [Bacillus sp. REN16]
MRKIIILIIMLITIIPIIGCNTKINIENAEEQIEETRVIKEEEKLVIGIEQEMIEISDKAKVDAVIGILQKANWENAEVSMDGPFDFIINNK